MPATNYPAGQNVLSIQNILLPLGITATQLAILADFNGVSSESGGVTISHAVYTLSGSVANLASSASRGITWVSGSATNVSSQFGGVSGTQYRTIDVSYAMTPGNYLFGWCLKTSGSVIATILGNMAVNIVGTFDGIATSNFLNGISTSTIAAMPPVISANDPGYVRTGISALRQPGAILIGTNS